MNFENILEKLKIHTIPNIYDKKRNKEFDLNNNQI